jgi:Ca2+-binding EF-hand superfamily protein
VDSGDAIVAFTSPARLCVLNSTAGSGILQPKMEQREMTMTVSRRSLLLSVALPLAALAPAGAASPLSILDPDRDGTVSLAEAKAAAAKVFDRLERDKDGTLDAQELRGRVSKAELIAADPDKDGTLDKDEYMRLVEARFRAADPDNDGTLDARELRSPAGKALLKLLL